MALNTVGFVTLRLRDIRPGDLNDHGSLNPTPLSQYLLHGTKNYAFPKEKGAKARRFGEKINKNQWLQAPHGIAVAATRT